MATIAELMVKIGADTSGAESGFSRIASGAGNVVTSLAKIGIAGATAIAGGLVAATVSGIKGITAMEDATAQMNAVLKSTNDASGMTADALINIANAAQLHTKFTQEETLAGENLLLTFTNIGSDVFPQATQTLLDMATAMGGDASSNAIQLGKALNDPTEGISALTRVGVTFTDEQKKQIQAMQEAGDMAGAQSVILQELQKEFGGSAEAAGKTFAGQLEIAKNALGELTESMAMGVMPALTEMITAINEAANSGDWSSVGETVGGAFDSIITNVMDSMANILPVVQEVGMSIINSLLQGLLNNAPTLVQTGLSVILGLVDILLQNLPLIVEVGLQAIVSLALGIADALPELIPTIVDTMLTIVDTLIDNIDMLVDAAIEIILALAQGLINAMPKLIEKIPEIIIKLVKAIIDNAPKMLDAAIQLMIMLSEGLASGFSEIFGKIGSWIKENILDPISEKVSEFAEIGGNLIKGIWDGISDKAEWLWGKVSGFFTNLTDKIRDFFGIHSPSTVYAEIGGYMAEGIGVGFTDEMGNVTSTMKVSLNSVLAMANDKASELHAIMASVFNGASSVSGLTATYAATADHGKIVMGLDPSIINDVANGNINIPGLATGGTLASSGSVLVGENGPELLNLNAGASVIPLNNTSGNNININISGNYIAEKYDTERMGEDLVNYLSRKGIKIA